MSDTDAGMYRERRSTRIGGTVWTRSSDGTAGWILPDGCLDVLWDGHDLTVAGPDTVAHQAEVSTATSLAAVRFDTGVGPAVLGVPADAVRDQRPLLADLLPRDEVERLAEALHAATTDPGQVLEGWAAGRLAVGSGTDPSMHRVVELLGGGLRVADVADVVGLGERQLHRRSLAAFGYGPKVLARILRMQRALDLARHGTQFARTAAEAGYADQAHLAREVKALAGRPLGELVATS